MKQKRTKVKDLNELKALYAFGLISLRKLEKLKGNPLWHLIPEGW